MRLTRICVALSEYYDATKVYKRYKIETGDQTICRLKIKELLKQIQVSPIQIQLNNNLDLYGDDLKLKWQEIE